jgi:hypothetical protein
MDDFPDAITVDGRTLPLKVARKRVRNLNARLKDGAVHVSAPLRAERAWIDASIPDLARTLLRRERRRTVNEDGLALSVARRVAARFEEPHPVERVEFEAGRTSVWGTWHGATRTVRLSAVLRHMPPAVLEGVVAHELCHARWRTHGPRFQALLRRIDPRADWAKGFLDGAAWMARNGGRIPATDLGPLAAEPEPPGDPPPPA